MDGLPVSKAGCVDAKALRFVNSCPFADFMSRLRGINTDHSQRTENSTCNLECMTCSEAMGIEESGLESVKLFKWSACIRDAEDRDWEALPVQNILCAQLLAMIESRAIYKFLAYSGDVEDAEQAILVSITHQDSFAPAIDFDCR